MTTTTFFFIFIPLLAIILLAVNLIFAPHNPYQEKDSAFECGFHSFLGQNRTQFSISFFIFALLFLLFDLEILLVYPYVVSAYTNGIYGLAIMLIFFLALTLGFAFELGKNALKIESRQMLNLSSNNLSTTAHISKFSLRTFFEFLKDEYKDKFNYIIRFINSLAWVLSSPPKAHGFVSLPLQSDMTELREIITSIDSLLPVLSNFIDLFNNELIKNNINVVTDAMGNMDMDVPGRLTETEARDVSKRIGIIDRIINSKGSELHDLFQRGKLIEDGFKAENRQYVSQISVQMRRFIELNNAYKH